MLYEPVPPPSPARGSVPALAEPLPSVPWPLSAPLARDASSHSVTSETGIVENEISQVHTTGKYTMRPAAKSSWIAVKSQNTRVLRGAIQGSAEPAEPACELTCRSEICYNPATGILVANWVVAPKHGTFFTANIRNGEERRSTQ